MSTARNLRRRRPPAGIADARAALDELVARNAAEVPVAAPSSPWEREKLRQTYGATALRARWVVPAR